jgi:hypothetical protein
MPICPGCLQSVSYSRLDVHEQYCEELDGEASEGEVTAALERLDMRLTRLESQVAARNSDEPGVRRLRRLTGRR